MDSISMAYFCGGKCMFKEGTAPQNTLGMTLSSNAPTIILVQENSESQKVLKAGREKSILKSYGKNIYTSYLYRRSHTSALLFLDIYPSVLQHPKVSMYSTNEIVKHFIHAGRSKNELDVFL